MSVDNFEIKYEIAVKTLFGFKPNNAKWWKVKTSFWSMLAKLKEFSNTNKIIDIVSLNKTHYLVNEKFQVHKSTFGQYYKIWCFFGAIEFDEHIPSYNKFSTFIETAKGFTISNDFFNSVSIENYIVELDLKKVVTQNKNLINDSCFMWKVIMNLVYTISVYYVTNETDWDNSMKKFLKDFTMKNNTDYNSAFAEFKLQKKLIELIN